MTDREKHIQVLEQFLHDYKEWGEDLELEKTIEYAISSLKTDEAYQVMYEGGEIFTKADMVAMLEELQTEIEELQGKYSPYYDEASQHTSEIIQQKIDKLRGDNE